MTDAVGTLVYAEGYDYDPAGNRSTRYYTPPSGSTENFAFSYDARNRLQSDGVDTYIFDDDGRMVGRSTVNGLTLGWNSKDRLLTIQSSQSTTTNTYDVDGNWVRSTVVQNAGSSTTTRFVVDTQRELSHVAAEVDDLTGVVDARYVRAGDLMLGILRPGANRFVHSTHLDSVRTLTGSNGTTTDSYRYDPFGNILEHVGSTENRYLYAGEPRGLASGLAYHRARWMDAQSGRFLSIDPLTLQPSTGASLANINKYTYVTSNPVNLVDPTGLIVPAGTKSLAVAASITSGLALLGAGAKLGVLTGGAIAGVALSAGLGTKVISNSLVFAGLTNALQTAPPRDALALLRSDLRLGVAGTDDSGTLAMIEWGGERFFGQNGEFEHKTSFSINSISGAHAEADAIAQALDKFGPASGGEAHLWTDRALCDPCGKPRATRFQRFDGMTLGFGGMSSLARELGVQQLIVHAPDRIWLFVPPGSIR